MYIGGDTHQTHTWPALAVALTLAQLQKQQQNRKAYSFTICENVNDGWPPAVQISLSI